MSIPGAQNTSAHQPVRAPRGTARSCKGWQQEAVLRLLLNCLDPEVAERPQDLFVSGAAGKAAADWESLQSILAALRKLESDESLRIESGHLAGVLRTTPDTPRVIVANAAAGRADCGNWLCAGTQTALPLLYEVYGAAAREHFAGTLAGKLVVGGGMGGAGGAQPLAAALHGAAFLGIDADAEHIKRRVKTGYCEVMVTSLDEALRMLKNAVRQHHSASVGLLGNCAELFPALARRGVVPDLLTDSTPAAPHLNGYIPAGSHSAAESAAAQLQGVRQLETLGTRVIDATRAHEYLKPLLEEGWRLTTWLPLSGVPAEIAQLDKLALQLFPGGQRLQRWLAPAANYVRFQGLPARVSWLKRQQFGTFAAAVNDVVARGELTAPVLLGWHDLASEPHAPGTGASLSEKGACWTWSGNASAAAGLHAISAQAFVADGTPDAGARLSGRAVSESLSLRRTRRLLRVVKSAQIPYYRHWSQARGWFPCALGSQISRPAPKTVIPRSEATRNPSFCLCDA